MFCVKFLKKLCSFFVFLLLSASFVYASSRGKIEPLLTGGQINFNIGDTATLSIDGVDDLEWFCDDDSVVELQPNGAIKAVGAGDVEVLAFSDDDFYSFKVQVSSSAPQKLYFSEKSIVLTKGEQITLPLVCAPGQSFADMDVKFSSSDRKVAVVNKAGVLRAVGHGVAVISASTPDGKTARMRVDVVSSSQKPSSKAVNPEEAMLRKALSDFYSSKFNAGEMNISVSTPPLGDLFKVDPISFDYALIDDKCIMQLNASAEISGIGMFFGIKPFCVAFDDLSICPSYSILDRKVAPTRKIPVLQNLKLDKDDVEEFKSVYNASRGADFDYTEMIPFLEKVADGVYSVRLYFDDDDVSSQLPSHSFAQMFKFQKPSQKPEEDDNIVLTFKIENSKVVSCCADVYTDEVSYLKPGEKLARVDVVYKAFGDEVFSVDEKGDYIYIPHR